MSTLSDTVGLVTNRQWNFDASDGDLIVKTGVTGRASRIGHRLTIALNSWRATISCAGDKPLAAEVSIDVESLEVLKGEGGVTALSGPEKSLVRSNALKSLGVSRFRSISYRTENIIETAQGYRLTGILQIRRTPRPQTIDLKVEDLDDVWRMSFETEVRQSEFGVKPFSMFMGSMKVADAVTVSFTGSRAKDG